MSLERWIPTIPLRWRSLFRRVVDANREWMKSWPFTWINAFRTWCPAASTPRRPGGRHTSPWGGVTQRAGRFGNLNSLGYSCSSTVDPNSASIFCSAYSTTSSFLLLHRISPMAGLSLGCSSMSSTAAR